MTPTIGPTESDTPFLPIEFQLPTDFEEVRDEISERHRLIADQVNAREVALYEPTTDTAPTKLLTGKRYWGLTAAGVIDNRQKRYTYRSVVDFGTLPNTGTKSVAHGIPVTAAAVGPPATVGTQFTRIDATANHPTNTDPLPKAIQLNFVDTAAGADDIELQITDTNVVITTASAAFAGFTQCYITLEYFLEGSI